MLVKPPKFLQGNFGRYRIKTDKGIWWMPRQYEPMKDVVANESLGKLANKL